MNYTDVFSKRLKILRNENGFKQKELGEKIKSNQKSISAYENTGRVPELNTLVALSKVLGVTIDYLVGATDVKELTPNQKKKVDHYMELVVSNSDLIKSFDLIELLDRDDRNNMNGRMETLLEAEKYTKKGQELA